MIYTSINNDKIKNIKKLNSKKYRNEFNSFLIEGEHLVEEAYNKGLLSCLILEENCKFKLDIETIYVSESVLKHISQLDNPSNIMGVCKKIESNNNLGNKVLVLDDIQDPGNLGTIIRSCVAFNIDTIILSNNSVDLYNSKVIRATQGMIFNINIIEKNLEDIIPILKKENYKIYGTNVNNGKSLKNVEKCKKFVIIMGNEGRGVRNSLLDICDDYIYIDMNKNCESLNVAVATSIILYEFSKE